MIRTAHIFHGIAGILVALVGGMLAMQGIAFAGPTGIFILLVGAGGFLFFWGLRTVRNNFDPRYRGSSTEITPTNRPSAEDRLDELERLKRRDMVTAEEYAAKRQEILKDL
jgi:hypothetical protein